MGFLAPWFLGALAMAGLPVWLHLLRQHKTTPVQFSSLMFFERRTTTSTRQRRLRYYALLAVRLLALLFLIFAFAQPYFERTVPAGGGTKLTVAAIDNSFSMRRGDSLANARNQALSLASNVRAGAPGMVVAFGSAAREMGRKAEDTAAFRAQVNAVAAGDEKTSYAELARVLRGVAEANKMPLAVHLYTDLQKSGLPPRFADLQLPADSTFELHDVAPTALANYTVESVVPPGRIFDTAKARIRATLAAYNAPAATRSVALIADGRTLATQQAAIPENGRVTVEFTGLETGYGFHRGEIRLEGSPDAFPNDDKYLFAIERSDPRRVLLLHPARDSRTPVYLKAAIEAASPNGYRLETATYESVASPSLENISFVVVADPGNLGATLEAALKSYVERGGSVWIAAGSATGGQSKLPIAGLAIKESRIASRNREMFHTLASRETLHPVLERAAGIETVKFYQIVSIEPGPKSKVLARTGDATPVLIDHPMGEGRMLILGSPLDNLGNNLPLHPAFLPLVERAAQYLARQEESTGVVQVGAAVELRAANDRATAVEVLDPAGARLLSLEQAAKTTSFAAPSEGFYEIRRANGRQSLVAVNADRRESDFSRIEPETLSLWKATGESGNLPGGPQAPSGERTERFSPWWWLLLAVTILTLVEGVLSSQYLFGSSKAAAAGTQPTEPEPVEVA